MCARARFEGADNHNIVLVHLARAADALEHAQEDDDPSGQEAQGQGPPDGARVVKALAVYYTQHTLTATQTHIQVKHIKHRAVIAKPVDAL